MKTILMSLLITASCCIGIQETALGFTRKINILETVLKIQNNTVSEYIVLDFLNEYVHSPIRIVIFDRSNQEIIVEYQNNEVERIYSIDFIGYLAQIAVYLEKYNTSIENSVKMDFSIPIKSKNNTKITFTIIRII